MRSMNISKITPLIINNSKVTLPAIRYDFSTFFHQASTSKKAIASPVSEVSAKILKSLMHSETIFAKTFITERSAGKKVPVYITKFERSDKKYLYLKDENTEKLGSIVLEFPQQNSFKAPKSDTYSLEVTSLESVNKGNSMSPFRGIGTELLKAAVKESKRCGYDGRIHLMAYDSHPPTPFYYKCGLRFLDDNKNKLMEQFLASSKIENVVLDDTIKKGYMYLPSENVDKLLAM